MRFRELTQACSPFLPPCLPVCVCTCGTWWLVQLMGQEKKALHGFSAAAAGVKHGGVIYGAEVVLSAPPALQQKALKVVASK